MTKFKKIDKLSFSTGKYIQLFSFCSVNYKKFDLFWQHLPHRTIFFFFLQRTRMCWNGLNSILKLVAEKSFTALYTIKPIMLDGSSMGESLKYQTLLLKGSGLETMVICSLKMCSCLMEEYMNARDWNMFNITLSILMVWKQIFLGCRNRLNMHDNVM